MSLFKKIHKLKALDTFAFTGPAGNIPKPVKEEQTKTNTVVKDDDNCIENRDKIVSQLVALGLTPKGEPKQDDGYTTYKFSLDKDTSFDRVAKILMYKNNVVFGVKGNELWVNVGPTPVIVSDSNKMNDELIQSSSKEALGKNIATEIKSGKDPKQAAAIAYSVQKENLKDAGGFVLCKTDTDYRGVKSKRYVAYYTDYYKTYSTEDSKDAALFSNMETAKNWQKHLQRETNWDIVPSSVGKPIKSKILGDKNTLKDDLGYKPDICGCMDFTDIENIVHTTIQYIKAKYPNEENTMEKWLSLIGEEFGELCQAINDGEVNNVIEEGTQTIAAIYLMLSDFIINANVLASIVKE